MAWRKILCLPHPGCPGERRDRSPGGQPARARAWAAGTEGTERRGWNERTLGTQNQSALGVEGEKEDAQVRGLGVAEGELTLGQRVEGTGQCWGGDAGDA